MKNDLQLPDLNSRVSRVKSIYSPNFNKIIQG